MGKPLKPRFGIGQRVGSFIVTEHIGHTTVNPRTHHILQVSQHWYRCRCDCRRYDLRSQQELRDTRRQQMCKGCRKESRSNWKPWSDMTS